MPEDIKIEHVTIGTTQKPFIIAEMSGNHNKSLDRALAIIDAAADAGAHAIKLQTYTAETITIDMKGGLFDINDPTSLWKGRNLFDLYKSAYTPWEWHAELFERARKRGLIIFSTPFDDTAVDFLEELNVSAYKIASFENNHFPLLRKIASTGKPVIMSTGLSTLAGLEAAVSTLRNAGCKDLVLLKCTSTYPASPVNSHISTIPHMAQLFDCHVGLSDHTLGVGVPVAAVALGARVVEKHFTLSRAEGGVDSAFSLEPHELKLLVEESERAFDAMGKVTYGILPDEEKSLRFKRSVYVINDIKEGDVFTDKNIGIIRPGDGLETPYYELLLGKTAKVAIARGTPLNFNHIL
ncbi:MAG TPA: pseudaminic acid synthase [Chitinophagales bacterium]|nr:pseudaminic acid synthase [Chitinophagales bacterium]